MLIKRSVSPDGRIDSVSVEFSMPVSDISNGEIKQRALSTLELQKEIVGAFLKLNGSKASPVLAQGSQPAKTEGADGKPTFARIIDSGHKKRRELSEEIRRSFESSGVYYYAALTQNSPKAHRFIKPLQVSDPPVTWWSSLLLLHIGSEPTPTPPPQCGV